MWKDMTGKVWEMARTSAEIAKGVAESVADKGAEALKAAEKVKDQVVDKAEELGEKAAVGVGSVATSAADAARKAADVATDKVVELTESATTAVHKAKEGVEKAAAAVGEKTQAVGEQLLENQIYKALVKQLGKDWLIDVVNGLDYAELSRQVAQRKREHGDATEEQVAARVITDKSHAGKALSPLKGLLPDDAPADLRDFVGLVAAQAETVLEVAGAFGHNVSEPARRGEVLLVLGMVAGADKAAIELARMAMTTSSGAGVGPVMDLFATQLGISLSRRTLLRQLPVLGGLFKDSLNYSALVVTGKGAFAFYAAQEDGENPDAAQTTDHLVAVAAKVGDLIAGQEEQKRRHFQILHHAALTDARVSAPEQQYLASFLTESGFPPEEQLAWLAAGEPAADIDALLAAITDHYERRTLLHQVATMTELEGGRSPAAQALLDRLATSWGVSLDR